MASRSDEISTVNRSTGSRSSPKPAGVEAIEEKEVISDGRLRRGARARRTIAERAAAVASEESLTGLSIGRLAQDLSMSKSSIQTLFSTKEALQLAAIESAAHTFRAAVIDPALTARAGRSRLRALLERWLDYAQEPVFPGGCFWTANLAEFDGRPGPVRDALLDQHDAWLTLLAEQVERTTSTLDPRLTAFQLDAILSATNIQLRAGNTTAPRMARRAITAILAPGRAKQPR